MQVLFFPETKVSGINKGNAYEKIKQLKQVKLLYNDKLYNYPQYHNNTLCKHKLRRIWFIFYHKESYRDARYAYKQEENKPRDKERIKRRTGKNSRAHSKRFAGGVKQQSPAAYQSSNARKEQKKYRCNA